MSSVIVKHILRGLILILLQVLVFKNIHIAGFPLQYLSIIIYPIIIIFLPVGLNNIYILGIGFVIGLFVDSFYNSPGIHASALVLLGFVRPFFLQIFQPPNGYRQTDCLNISTFGLSWIVYYGGSMLFVFLFYYFSVEAFSFVYIGSILLKTIFTVFPSFLIILMYFYLFNPKY